MFVRLVAALAILCVSPLTAAAQSGGDSLLPSATSNSSSQGTIAPTSAAASSPTAGRPATTTGAAGNAAQGTAATGDAVRRAQNVDESALRYFARQGDLDRLEAEIRRLRALYPNWQPPVDLLDPGASGGPSDVQPVWDLYGAGRIAEARQALSRLQASKPGWQPPADLVAALGDAEARQRMINAAANKQWNTVLTIANQNASLLVCGRMDVLWLVADAFAATDKKTRAQDVYTYILKNCANPQERRATIERAIATLSPDMMTPLFALERSGPDGKGEFSGSRLDFIRRVVGDAARDGKTTVAPGDLDELERAAHDSKEPNDALLLGFYFTKRGDTTKAYEWFKIALDRGGGAKAAEGYVYAMHEAGQDLRAEATAYKWRDASDANMVAYILLVSTLLNPPTKTGQASDVVAATAVDQEIVDRFVPVVMQRHSPLGALSLGWYAFNTKQFGTAADWFQQSLDWQPSEAAAYGLGLAMHALGSEQGLQAVLDTWTSRFARLPGLLQAAFMAAVPVQTTTLTAGQVSRLQAQPGPGAPAVAPRTPMEIARAQALAQQQVAAGQPVAVAVPQTQALAMQATVPAAQAAVPQVAGAQMQAAQVQAAQLQPAQTIAVRGTAAPAAPARPPVDMNAPITAAKLFAISGGGATAEAPQVAVAGQVPATAMTTPGQAVAGQAVAVQAGTGQVAAGQPVGWVPVAGGGQVATTQVAAAPAAGGGVAGNWTQTSRATMTGGNRLPPSSSQVQARQRPSGCASLINRRGAISAQQALNRGWCLLDLNRPLEAAESFGRAMAGAPGTQVGSDAAYGQSLAYLRAGLTDDAAVSASDAPLATSRKIDLSSQILTQRAVASYQAGRYADAIAAMEQRNAIIPESRDDMLLRGWAYYNLGEIAMAKQIFEAVDRSASTGDSRRALSAVNDRGRTRTTGGAN